MHCKKICLFISPLNQPKNGIVKKTTNSFYDSEKMIIFATEKRVAMNTNEQTNQQIERFFRKTAEKFPPVAEPTLMTDIHIRVFQDSGEMLSFDDDDQEITRCVVESWIDNKDEQFYDSITKVLRLEITRMSKSLDNLGIIKPYSFVLEDDDKENIAELYVADDDTIIIGGDLMKNLETDLDSFLDDLLKDA